MATDKPRFSLTLDERTMSQVLAYQQKHGLSTKSRAIQALVQSGLEDYKEKSPGPIEPRDEKDVEFMRLFSQLSEEQRRFLVAVMKVLIEQSQGPRPGPPPKAAETD